MELLEILQLTLGFEEYKKETTERIKVLEENVKTLANLVNGLTDQVIENRRIIERNSL